MSSNHWIIAAIHDLQQMADQNSLDDVTEGLREVYHTAERELRQRSMPGSSWDNSVKLELPGNVIAFSKEPPAFTVWF